MVSLKCPRNVYCTGEERPFAQFLRATQISLILHELNLLRVCFLWWLVGWLVGDRISLCFSGWLRTHYVQKAGVELI